MCSNLGDRPLVLLNATHTVTGGGLIYLQSLLPELARYADFRWIVLAPAKTLSMCDLPSSWTARPTPPLGYLGRHLWEQFVLPILARRWGVSACLCNASYVPMFISRPIPILHAPIVDGLTHERNWRAWLYWWALYRVTSLSIRRSGYVITTADHLLDDFPAGTALAARGRARSALPGVPPWQTNAAKDANLVVAVGDIYAHKDYPTLVRAMAKLVQSRPQTRLEIIGAALDDTLAAELKQLIADLKLEHAVQLKGHVPHEQTLQRIAEAGALVSASLAETSNMVVVEAMALGTPLVLLDMRFQRHVAADAALFVDPQRDKVQGFCLAIMKVLDDRARHQAMSEAGRRVAARFDWAASAAAIVELLRQAVNPSHRHGDKTAP